MRYLFWLSPFVLVFGCFDSEVETIAPWPVEETETEALSDVVILRASDNDPFYGGWDEFYGDVPSSPEQTHCAGTVISLEFPFDPPTDAILILPRMITGSLETYAFEIERTWSATWVWESEELGVVWASNTPVCGDPFSGVLQPLRFVISAYPYAAQPPQPMPGGSGPELLCTGPGCGLMPSDQAEVMVRPPLEFDLEVLSNGIRTVVPMKAEVSESENQQFFRYQASPP